MVYNVMLFRPGTNVSTPRDCIDVLLPYLTAMVNASLREGSLPESQKRAVVTPLLKKPSLDYCNAILTGAADGQIRRLQAVQNAAARLVSGARPRDSISPILRILRSLHWLPVRRRVIFKSAVIAWKLL